MDALLLGLSSGATCLATCAAFFFPALATESDSPRLRRLVVIGLFLLGRFLAYLAVGTLVGLLGGIIDGYLAPKTDRLILRMGWSLGGAALILGSLVQFENHRFCRNLSSRLDPSLAVFVLGAAAGFNLCPPFVAAATRAIGLGAVGGALYFALFFLGTSVWTLVFVLVPTLKRRGLEIRKIARIAMLMLGVYFLLILGILGWS